MSGNIKIQVKLTKNQKAKLRSAHKRGRNVKVRLSPAQLRDSGDEIVVNPKQYKKIQSALKAKKPRGVQLEFTAGQVGGFLGTLASIFLPLAISGISNAVRHKNFFTGNGIDLPGHSGGSMKRITYKSKKKPHTR